MFELPVRIHSNRKAEVGLKPRHQMLCPKGQLKPLHQMPVPDEWFRVGTQDSPPRRQQLS